MVRHLDIRTIRFSTIFLTIIFLNSCGPRSGVHHDNETEKDKVVQTPICGNALDNESSSDGAKLFKINCAVCHSAFTDQNFLGPGLKGIKYRLPNPPDDWFIKYTINCDKVFASGDAYAAKLRGENKDQRMTVFEGILTEEDAREIYNYLTKSMATEAVP